MDDTQTAEEHLVKRNATSAAKVLKDKADKEKERLLER